ncbi:adhesin [uncultured Methanobrevibacter sp.]|uniref:adhesin n=1 Tax=uncultured Methanobrevibacter sp. TaxID=253161 RepID=UPI002616754D
MRIKDDKSDKKSRKPSKKLIYLLIIILIILAESFILCYDYINNDDSVLAELSEDYPFLNDVLSVFPRNVTDSGDLNVKSKVIGNNSIGNVVVEGPYGNPNSSVRIAYIIGQHPRESNAHDAIYEALRNDWEELNYTYYVFKINVTSEKDDFEESRMNGQLLAQEFVVNHIVKKGYDLAIDVHSSNGGYVQDPYIFAPVSSDSIAYKAANNITKALSFVIYYEPASYSSPQYSTIPIDEGGVPSLVFEMRGNPDHSLEYEAREFVKTVDNLKL